MLALGGEAAPISPPHQFRQTEVPGFGAAAHPSASKLAHYNRGDPVVSELARAGRRSGPNKYAALFQTDRCSWFWGCSPWVATPPQQVRRAIPDRPRWLVLGLLRTPARASSLTTTTRRPITNNRPAARPSLPATGWLRCNAPWCEYHPRHAQPYRNNRVATHAPYFGGAC